MEKEGSTELDKTLVDFAKFWKHHVPYFAVVFQLIDRMK